MVEGETVVWEGRSIQFVRLTRDKLADKLVAQAELAISTGRGDRFTLLPAQHRHKGQDVWTTEAAIHPTWSEDFYTILHNGEGSQAHFTFIVNPLMRWMWFGGWVIGLSTLAGLWPEQLLRRKEPEERTSERPAHVRRRARGERPSATTGSRR
jgi:cytochrome c-type biogenesis protein CcmF